MCIYIYIDLHTGQNTPVSNSYIKFYIHEIQHKQIVSLRGSSPKAMAGTGGSSCVLVESLWDLWDLWGLTPKLGKFGHPIWWDFSWKIS